MLKRESILGMVHFMATSVFFGALVILLAVLAEKFAGKFKLPALILFMFIGMLFGSDGLFKIPFSNYRLADQICSLALVFIMFYGGFNTKWKVAKSSAPKSLLLSTLGVIITAGITTVLAVYLLHFKLLEALLIGAVLSSTDAASVFAILHQQKVNLKYNTASLLELESGSNDPVAYLLTALIIGFITGAKQVNIPLEILLQVSMGLWWGFILAKLAVYLLTQTNLIAEGLETIFLMGMMLLCYALTEVTAGNVFLSIYLLGLIIGNAQIANKQVIIPFLHGITSLAQILIFFLLGLLTFPHRMLEIIPTALIIAIIITFIARPLAVFTLLLPFKAKINQCLLVAWAGLRGAASSVFAIFALAHGVSLNYDLFHIVFLVSLFSIALQGSLLPWVATKLDMIDESDDIRKTFNDYQAESAITLMRLFVPKDHPWVNRPIKDVHLPSGSLALMIKRNSKTIITKGDTIILGGDILILSVPAYETKGNETLNEINIDANHPWAGQKIATLNLPDNMLIALIIRGEENLIPDGNTVIEPSDTVVLYH